MNLTTRVGLLAGATAMTLTGVSAAATTDANAEELRTQIDRLNARVAELEGKGGNWLTEQRASEVRGIVNDVLADADTRASLLGSGLNAGYDDGFTIGSADGNFALRLNGQAQFRYNYSYQSDAPAAGGGDRHRSGFENTRTKLWFTGHVVNPNWQYVIEGNFGAAGGAFGLLDAYVKYDAGNGMSITAGQFKLPLTREFLVDSRYQQLVERSVVDAVFAGGRSQGIMFGFEQDMFRVSAAVSDGAGMANSRWNAGPAAGSTEWSFTGRGEFLIGGTWDQFDHGFGSPAGEEMGIMIGAAAHWQDGEYGTGFNNETELLVLTADVTAKFGGFNVFGAYHFSHTDVNMGPAAGVPGNWRNHGIVAQGGFQITDEFEVFGRYEHIWFDSDLNANNLSILTGGVNYFISGHQAKLTADIGYAFKEMDVAGVAGQTGWRNDGGSDDGQIVIRTQLQLLF